MTITITETKTKVKLATGTNVTVSPTTLTAKLSNVGMQGAAGPGVAVGGSAGQYLRKKSASDYDTEWASLGKAASMQTSNNATTGTVAAVISAIVGNITVFADNNGSLANSGKTISSLVSYSGLTQDLDFGSFKIKLGSDYLHKDFAGYLKFRPSQDSDPFIGVVSQVDPTGIYALFGYRNGAAFLQYGASGGEFRIEQYGGDLGTLHCGFLMADYSIISTSDYQSSSPGQVGIGDYTTLYHIAWNIDWMGRGTFASIFAQGPSSIGGPSNGATWFSIFGNYADNLVELYDYYGGTMVFMVDAFGTGMFQGDLTVNGVHSAAGGLVSGSHIWAQNGAVYAMQIQATNSIYLNAVTNTTLGGILEVSYTARNPASAVSNGFGARHSWKLKTSGASSVDAAFDNVYWENVTQASRTARRDFGIADFAQVRTAISISADGTQVRLGLFGSAPVVRQTRNAYTTNAQSSAYTTTGAGADIASKADLNSLRVAYENLRASYDDLRTKIGTSTLMN